SNPYRGFARVVESWWVENQVGGNLPQSKQAYPYQSCGISCDMVERWERIGRGRSNDALRGIQPCGQWNCNSLLAPLTRTNPEKPWACAAGPPARTAWAGSPVGDPWPQGYAGRQKATAFLPRGVPHVPAGPTVSADLSASGRLPAAGSGVDAHHALLSA